MPKLRNIIQNYQQISTHTTNQIKKIIIQMHYRKHHTYQTSILTDHYLYSRKILGT